MLACINIQRMPHSKQATVQQWPKEIQARLSQSSIPGSLSDSKLHFQKQLQIQQCFLFPNPALGREQASRAGEGVCGRAAHAPAQRGHALQRCCATELFLQLLHVTQGQQSSAEGNKQRYQLEEIQRPWHTPAASVSTESPRN